MVDNTGRFFLKPEQICNYYHYSNLCILIMVHQRYNFTVRKIRAAKDGERDRLLEIPLEFHREQTFRYTLRLGEIPQPCEKKPHFRQTKLRKYLFLDNLRTFSQPQEIGQKKPSKFSKVIVGWRSPL